MLEHDEESSEGRAIASRRSTKHLFKRTQATEDTLKFQMKVRQVNDLLDTFLDIPGMDKIRAHNHKSSDLKHMGIKAINSGAKAFLDKEQDENQSSIWNDPDAVQAALNDTNATEDPTIVAHMLGKGFMTELQGYKGPEHIKESEFESSDGDHSSSGSSMHSVSRGAQS